MINYICYDGDKFYLMQILKCLMFYSPFIISDTLQQFNYILTVQVYILQA